MVSRLLLSPFGTPKSEAAGRMRQTIARWGMELEADMRQVPISIRFPRRTLCSDAKDSSRRCIKTDPASVDSDPVSTLAQPEIQSRGRARPPARAAQ
eukprot:816330-Amphidinium_carterae.2